jgi:hypothetical protein
MTIKYIGKAVWLSFTKAKEKQRHAQGNAFASHLLLPKPQTADSHSSQKFAVQIILLKFYYWNSIFAFLNNL